MGDEKQTGAANGAADYQGRRARWLRLEVLYQVGQVLEAKHLRASISQEHRAELLDNNFVMASDVSTRVVAVVGAGASAGRFPRATETVGHLMTQHGGRHMKQALARQEMVWNWSADEFEPLLSALTGDPESNSAVRRDLAEFFGRVRPTTMSYSLIAHLLQQRYIDAVINYNFDELLDECIQLGIGESEYRFVIGDRESGHVNTDPDDPGYLPLYLKPHGTAREPESLRMTFPDYYASENVVGETIGQLFGDGNLLILNFGHGLADPDLCRQLARPTNVTIVDCSYEPIRARGLDALRTHAGDDLSAFCQAAEGDDNSGPDPLVNEVSIASDCGIMRRDTGDQRRRQSGSSSPVRRRQSPALLADHGPRSPAIRREGDRITYYWLDHDYVVREVLEHERAREASLMALNANAEHLEVEAARKAAAAEEARLLANRAKASWDQAKANASAAGAELRRARELASYAAQRVVEAEKSSSQLEQQMRVQVRSADALAVQAEQQLRRIKDAKGAARAKESEALAKARLDVAAAEAQARSAELKAKVRHATVEAAGRAADADAAARRVVEAQQAASSFEGAVVAAGRAYDQAAKGAKRQERKAEKAKRRAKKAAGLASSERKRTGEAHVASGAERGAAPRLAASPMSFVRDPERSSRRSDALRFKLVHTMVTTSGRRAEIDASLPALLDLVSYLEDRSRPQFNKQIEQGTVEAEIDDASGRSGAWLRYPVHYYWPEFHQLAIGLFCELSARSQAKPSFQASYWRDRAVLEFALHVVDSLGATTIDDLAESRARRFYDKYRQAGGRSHLLDLLAEMDLDAGMQQTYLHRPVPTADPHRRHRVRNVLDLREEPPRTTGFELGTLPEPDDPHHRASRPAAGAAAASSDSRTLRLDGQSVGELDLGALAHRVAQSCSTVAQAHRATFAEFLTGVFEAIYFEGARIEIASRDDRICTGMFRRPKKLVTHTALHAHTRLSIGHLRPSWPTTRSREAHTAGELQRCVGPTTLLVAAGTGGLMRNDLLGPGLDALFGTVEADADWDFRREVDIRLLTSTENLVSAEDGGEWLSALLGRDNDPRLGSLDIKFLPWRQLSRHLVVALVGGVPVDGVYYVRRRLRREVSPVYLSERADLDRLIALFDDLWSSADAQHEAKARIQRGTSTSYLDLRDAEGSVTGAAGEPVEQ